MNAARPVDLRAKLDTALPATLPTGVGTGSPSWRWRWVSSLTSIGRCTTTFSTAARSWGRWPPVPRRRRGSSAARGCGRACGGAGAVQPLARGVLVRLSAARLSGAGPARQVLGGPHCAQATGAAAARRRRPIAGCFRVAGHPAGANPVRPQRNAPDREARGKGDPVAAHQVALRTWRRERPTGWTHDVSLPPFDPDSFGLTRVTRRLEGR
jgi:hypothetical protein